jgi:hypothetical protein
VSTLASGTLPRGMSEIAHEGTCASVRLHTIWSRKGRAARKAALDPKK